MHQKYPLNSNGYSLVEALTFMSLIGVAAMGAMKMGNILTKQQLQSNTTFQMSLVSREFTTTMQNASAWNATINAPANQVSTTASTLCLVNHSDCAGKNGAIQLMDAGANLLMGYDNMVPTNGFTASGEICNTFSAAGNDACPYRLDITWSPVCPAGAAICTDPVVRVSGKWRYSPSTVKRAVAFNAKNYDFVILQGSKAKNSYVMATAPGTQSLSNGTYSPVIFSAIASDSVGEFDGTYFRPRENGLYLISYNVSFGPLNWNGGGCRTAMIVDDTAGTSLGAFGVSASYPTNGPTNLCANTGTHAFSLQAGQRVWVQAIQTAGTLTSPISVSVSSGGYTTFSVTKVN